MIRSISLQVVQETLKERVLPAHIFCAGMVSLMAKAFFLGFRPHWLVLYTTIQWPLLFYIVYQDFAAKKKLFYFVELCWVFNFLGWGIVFLEIATAVGGIDPLFSDSVRNRLGYAFFVVVNGPLAFSVIMNSNALVLHDISKTSGVFIHFNPALVSYALRWRPVWTGSQSWSPFDNNGSFFASMTPAAHEYKGVGDAFLVYLLWLVPYALWLLVTCEILLSVPNRSSFKDLHKKLPGNTLSSKCWAYVIGHMTCSGTTFLCSQYFYSSFMLHTAWITGLLLYSAWLGSKYYSYTYGGDRVAKRLEERLAETEKAK
ncbi:hypothetical protein TrVE_jg3133 [Triparma verrucosa]|nr:hypothetical protein TrVE_jg3133 [Triparma verrucosa]